MPHARLSIIDQTPFPALEKLEVSMAKLPAQSIMAILSNSEKSLTGISFRLTTLGNDLTWPKLLSRIGNEFPYLTWFSLINISEGPIGMYHVTFPGLDKDSVIGEPDKNGLRLVRRGPAGNKRIPGVEYGGPDANHMLRIVAECAVAATVQGEAFYT